MTIDEIYKKEEISIRSYNICKSNELLSIEDLIVYYHKNKSFQKLRNCGKQSNEELIEVCNKYQEKISEISEIEVVKENPLKNSIANLTRIQREVINSFIFVNTDSLSARGKNAISLYLKGNLKVKNFADEIFLSKDFNVNNIQNVGAKTITELEVYFEIIKDFIIEVSQSDNEKHITSLKNNFLIQRTFSILKVPREILESESIFLLVNFLFYQNAFFDEEQTRIVKYVLKIDLNQKELTLDEIAEEVKLSKERVRQIKKLCLDKLFHKLLFIQNFNDDLFQKYGIDITSNYIDITSNIVDKVNKINNINLSKEFIIYILSAYLNKYYKLIGNYEDVLQWKQINISDRHNWSNLYLVKKEIVSEIDFYAFADDISSRLCDKIDELYAFHFKSYLSKFLTNNNIETLDLVFPIGEKIVNNEFELYLDLDENLIFNRNTYKQTYEYAYEALEQLNKPSKVREIFKKIKENYPNYDTEEAKVRTSMKRKDGFVPIERKSVFGLKKWEKELDNFKGGTIKDVVIDFLKSQNQPVHILSILEQLDKFRENKEAISVITNLKVDPMKRFVIFNQGFIGLQAKKNQYDNKYEKIPIQLGKKIISKHKRGYSIDAIKLFLKVSFDLSYDESELIINNLKYFHENKRD